MNHFSPGWMMSAMLAIPLVITQQFHGASNLGLFEANQPIGNPSKADGVKYDDSTGAYSVSGGGENMWFTNDAFHFAWTNLAGDFSLSAAVEWIGAGGNAHRKACLMIRLTPDADSPYVDVAVHGDGLTSLQWRSERGGPMFTVAALVWVAIDLHVRRAPATRILGWLVPMLFLGSAVLFLYLARRTAVSTRTAVVL